MTLILVKESFDVVIVSVTCSQPASLSNVYSLIRVRIVAALKLNYIISYKDFNAALTNYFQAFILQHIRLHLSATARQVMMVYDTCF